MKPTCKSSLNTSTDENNTTYANQAQSQLDMGSRPLKNNYLRIKKILFFWIFITCFYTSNIKCQETTHVLFGNKDFQTNSIPGDMIEFIDQCPDKGYIFNTLSGNIGNMNRQGNMLWSKSLSYTGLHVNAVTCDLSGNYVFTGKTDNVFPLSLALFSLSSSGLVNVAKKINVGATMHGTAVKQFPDSSYYITGYLDGGGTTMKDALLMKTNSQLTTQWIKIFHFSEFDYGIHVLPISNNQTMLSGILLDSFNFFNIFLLKLNNSGDVVGKIMYETTENDFISDIVELDDKGYVFTGYTGDSKMFVARIDSMGNILWTNHYVNSYNQTKGNSIIQANDEGFFIVADVNDGLKWQAALVKINKDGALEWAKQYGGKFDDYGRKIFKNDDTLILAGFSSSFRSLNEDSIGTNLYLVRADSYGKSNSCYERELTLTRSTLNFSKTSVFTSFEATLSSITTTDITLVEGSYNPGKYPIYSITNNPISYPVSCYNGQDGRAVAKPSGGTSGYIYYWKFLGNPPFVTTADSIENLKPGSYHCRVSDSNSCSVLDTVVITQPMPIAVTDTIISVKCHGGSDGIIKTGVSGGTSPYLYHWNNLDSTRVIQNLQADSYSLEVEDKHGCKGNFTLSVSAPASLTVSKVVDSTRCMQQNGLISLSVSGGVTPYQYSWSNALSNDTISNLSPGTYKVTVTDYHDCLLVDSVTIHNKKQETPSICMVTVDTSSWKNMVVWIRKRSCGIRHYIVYKESSTNVYDSIGLVAFKELSVFVDNTSNPKNNAEKYKIVAVDSCGQKSAYSPYHETMNLSKVKGLTDAEITLLWNKYIDEEGVFVPTQYQIYRGLDSSNLSLYTSITGGLGSYNVNITNALTNEYYQVRISKGTPCAPLDFLKASAGPFSQAVSNLEDNRLKEPGSIHETSAPVFFEVFPNPFTDVLTLRYFLVSASDIRLDIIDILGNTLYSEEIENQAAGVQSITVNTSGFNFSEGILIIRFKIDDSVYYKKVIAGKP